MTDPIFLIVDLFCGAVLLQAYFIWLQYSAINNSMMCGAENPKHVPFIMFKNSVCSIPFVLWLMSQIQHPVFFAVLCFAVFGQVWIFFAKPYCQRITIAVFSPSSFIIICHSTRIGIFKTSRVFCITSNLALFRTIRSYRATIFRYSKFFTASLTNFWFAFPVRIWWLRMLSFCATWKGTINLRIIRSLKIYSTNRANFHVFLSWNLNHFISKLLSIKIQNKSTLS